MVRKVGGAYLQEGGNCTHIEGREMGPCTRELTWERLIPIAFGFKNQKY